MSERHNYGSKFYNITLKKIIKNELLSYFGRLLSKKNITPNKKYLQLGCGESDLRDNYINCDFYNLDYFNPFKQKNIHYLDLRYPLPFKSNSFEGIFTEHTLEHLYPSEANNLLQEIYRVLKPGCIARISVPDLKTYINYYNNKNFFLGKDFKTGCEAVWNITQNYEHRSLWDAEWLIYNLKENGFNLCKEYEYRQSQNSDLILDKEGREIESIYIEATKPKI